jgi:hypothetical protein
MQAYFKICLMDGIFKMLLKIFIQKKKLTARGRFSLFGKKVAMEKDMSSNGI